MSADEDFIEFEIPDVSTLGRYTVSALRDLRLEADATFSALRESLSSETITDSDLSDLEALKTFMKAADKEINSRKSRAARFAAVSRKDKTVGDDDGDADDDGVSDDDETAEGADSVPHEAKEKAQNPTRVQTGRDGTNGVDNFDKKDGKKARKAKMADMPAGTREYASNVPSLADVARAGTAKVAPVQVKQVFGRTTPQKPDVEPMFTILAAADTGYSAGARLDGWLDVAKAFVARSHTHSGGTAQQSTVATIKREFTNENTISDGDDDISAMTKLDSLRNEANLPGGSLLAGAGWCAPSETIYTTCNQITADGLLNVPEVGARRGGIRHNQGISFDVIFGNGTGFNLLTEAQVIANTTKTCVNIPCPSFVDDRLKVSALCLTGDILQNRGYPEFVSEFVQGSIAAQAHNVNRQVIADIVAGSTAITLGNNPFTSDNTVLSQVMSAVDMAVVDIQYRLRLGRTQTIEVVFPQWLKAQIRADWSRRNGPIDPDFDDARINAMLATRNVRAQWVYDWQDAFTSTGVSGGNLPGSTLGMTEMPLGLTFLAYPAGTWVVARQDVIRLDTIYDSTNLATNKVTQLFLEDGFKAMQFCPISRAYTVVICPSGATAATRTVSC